MVLYICSLSLLWGLGFGVVCAFTIIQQMLLLLFQRFYFFGYFPPLEVKRQKFIFVSSVTFDRLLARKINFVMPPSVCRYYLPNYSVICIYFCLYNLWNLASEISVYFISLLIDLLVCVGLISASSAFTRSLIRISDFYM